MSIAVQQPRFAGDNGGFMKQAYTAPALLTIGNAVHQTLSGPVQGNEIAQPSLKHP